MELLWKSQAMHVMFSTFQDAFISPQHNTYVIFGFFLMETYYLSTFHITLNIHYLNLIFMEIQK